MFDQNIFHSLQIVKYLQNSCIATTFLKSDTWNIFPTGPNFPGTRPNARSNIQSERTVRLFNLVVCGRWEIYGTVYKKLCFLQTNTSGFRALLGSHIACACKVRTNRQTDRQRTPCSTMRLTAFVFVQILFIGYLILPSHSSNCGKTKLLSPQPKPRRARYPAEGQAVAKGWGLVHSTT